MAESSTAAQSRAAVVLPPAYTPVDPQTRAPTAPARQPEIRVRRRHHAREPASSDFLDFLHKLLDLIFAPVTIPLRWTRAVVTSPLTISLVLKLILASMLVVTSAVFSILAVGAFWYSWSTGGTVEVEGWLVYGHRTPHTQMMLPLDSFQEDLAYDATLELELVRPAQYVDDTSNFMLTLELRSLRSPEIIVEKAAQPSLPPPPLPTALLSLPSVTTFLPPCIIPWPFRGFCPSRLLGYDRPRPRAGRRKRNSVAPVKGKQVVLLTKDLLEGVVIKPGSSGGDTVGYAFVSIGREDAFNEGDSASSQRGEIRTTGWIVVRFTPRPTGIRPLPPLLILPPLSLGLTISSSLFAFLIITYCTGSRRSSETGQPRNVKHIQAEKEATGSVRQGKAPMRDAKGDGHDHWPRHLAVPPAPASSSSQDIDFSDTVSETGTTMTEATMESAMQDRDGASVSGSDAWED